MIHNLTDELYQTYSNENETIRVDILFNNNFNFFYFQIFKEDVLIQGDTKIVNKYENDFIKLFSLKACKGSFEDIKSFTLEFKNAN
jgi:hypothetical protein